MHKNAPSCPTPATTMNGITSEVVPLGGAVSVMAPIATIPAKSTAPTSTKLIHRTWRKNSAMRRLSSAAVRRDGLAEVVLADGVELTASTIWQTRPTENSAPTL